MKGGRRRVFIFIYLPSITVFALDKITYKALKSHYNNHRVVPETYSCKKKSLKYKAKLCKKIVSEIFVTVTHFPSPIQYVSCL